MGNHFLISLLFTLASISIFSFAYAQDKFEKGINLVEKKSDTSLVYLPVSDSILTPTPFPELNSSDLKNFNMKVYMPDSSLTENMPILVPKPIDERMVIPQFLGKQGRSGLKIIQ